jgi:TolB protein
MRSATGYLFVASVLLGLPAGTVAAAELKHPDWHPSGDLLVAEGHCSGNADLYLIDLEDGRVSRLLGDHRSEGYPRWFSDGHRIAFHRIDENRNSVVLIADLDADLRVRGLAQQTDGPFDIEPAPSPDGRQLAFSTSGETSLDVAILDVASGQVTTVWRTPGAENFPSWHPDGRSILFHTRSAEAATIWKRDLDTNDISRIPLSSGQNFIGSYDASGRFIAYNSERDGDREVYITDLQDQSERRLTSRPGRDGYPKVSADGKAIAWHAMLADGETVVRIMDLATGAERSFSCDGVA